MFLIAPFFAALHIAVLVRKSPSVGDRGSFYSSNHQKQSLVPRKPKTALRLKIEDRVFRLALDTRM